MNKFSNIYFQITKQLLSQERDDVMQITELDEDFFHIYRAKTKPRITVYRGDGRGVTRDSFKSLPFANIPAGGSPDITFRGVVEHTHTNTLKNGMVSLTTNPTVALGYATGEQHALGVVWELGLDDYIDVAELLKSRKFRNRYPDQAEVLYPGPVPRSKIISATLYEGTKRVAIRPDAGAAGGQG